MITWFWLEWIFVCILQNRRGLEPLTRAGGHCYGNMFHRDGHTDTLTTICLHVEWRQFGALALRKHWLHSFVEITGVCVGGSASLGAQGESVVQTGIAFSRLGGIRSFGEDGLDGGVNILLV